MLFQGENTTIYTRVPQRVRAVKWTGDNADEVKELLGDRFLGFDTAPKWFAYISNINPGGKPYEVPRDWYVLLYSNGAVVIKHPDDFIRELVQNPEYRTGGEVITDYKPARRFELQRGKDITGVSGTGVVASGIQWHDGRVVLKWHTESSSTVMWDSIEDAMHIHGHDGATKLVWLDK